MMKDKQDDKKVLDKIKLKTTVETSEEKKTSARSKEGILSAREKIEEIQIETKEELVLPKVSGAFEAGRVFEKHKGGVSEEHFVGILQDLQSNLSFAEEFESENLRKKDSHIKIDFTAGRLFERFRVGDQSHDNQLVLGEKMYRKLISEYEVVDMFDAGKYFARFCDKELEHLTPVDFQTLCRETPLGRALQKRMSEQQESDKAHDIRKHSSAEQSYKGKLEHQDTHIRKPIDTFHEAPEFEDDMDHLSKIRGSQIKQLDSQISLLENELREESFLKDDLPEAYSDEKVQMIRNQVQVLKFKREQYVAGARLLQRETRVVEPARRKYSYDYGNRSEKLDHYGYSKSRSHYKGIAEHYPLAPSAAVYELDQPYTPYW